MSCKKLLSFLFLSLSFLVIQAQSVEAELLEAYTSPEISFFDSTGVPVCEFGFVFKFVSQHDISRVHMFVNDTLLNDTLINQWVVLGSAASDSSLDSVFQNTEDVGLFFNNIRLPETYSSFIQLENSLGIKSSAIKLD